MDGRGERKARINYRSNVARLEKSRERKKKEKGEEDQGCALSLSRNAVQRIVSGEEERERGERVELDARGKERGVFNSAPGHVFQIEDNGKLRDAK